MFMYALSKLIPVRFSTLVGAHITEQEVTEGGHGNHFRSGEHYDAEHVTWWQWRGRIFRRRTVRMCLR